MSSHALVFLLKRVDKGGDVCASVRSESKIRLAHVEVSLVLRALPP